MNKLVKTARSITVIPKQEILFLQEQSIFVEDIVVRIDADIVLMGIIPKLYDVLDKNYQLDTVNLS
jgi:hypothetical protein